MNLADIKKQEEALVEAFNQNHKVGNPVVYHEFIDEHGELFGDTLETKTRSEAYLMCDSACVMLEDKSGCVAVSNVVVKKS